MSPPIFYGSRLREAREARQYTLQQVAEHLGITKQTVSLYEKAKVFPGGDKLQRLVEFLRVPPAFFSTLPLLDQRSPTFYRSMAAATKQLRDANAQKAKWLRQTVRYLGRYVEQPSAALPPCELPADPLGITDAQIEESAGVVRKTWGLGEGVISNVVHLLENKGIVVARFPLATDKMDAFSIIDDDTRRAYVVLNSEKENFFRSRHDAAHELGHLIMHRNVPPQVLQHTATFKEMERQAHRFASAFLLPATTFGREWVNSDVESFKAIKPKWKASISAMVMRAADLHLITDSQKTTLMMSMSRKGWRTREPLDDKFEPEIPRYFRRTCELIVEAGLASKDQILNDIGLNKADLESWFCMEGFFDDGPSGDVDSPQPILRFRGPELGTGT
jgi:Zn-dependent peptidase ImmA (M78 family)/transcriptional regulator with XRE-family HTH domain